jgi:hypothetical protein
MLLTLTAMASRPPPGQAAGPAPGAASHPPYAQLAGVSCPSARWCVAVGYHTIGGGPALYPLAEAWNGRSWRLLAPPAVHGTFLGVSCPRRWACIAVGSHHGATGGQASPLAATWNGHVWRLRPTPRLPRWPNVTDLARVSCTGPRHCVAVSGYGGAEPTETGAVEAWNGRSWRLRAVFDQSSLNGVACKNRTTCLAVGSTSPADDSWVPFAAARTGATWRTAPAPPGDTGDLDTSLSGVSCAATTLCMAVGDGMLIDQWTGSAWKQLTTPGLGALNGVSCKDTTACVAVGQDGQPAAAAMAWDGTSWRALAPVRPAGPSSLASVFCSAPARCMAVGYYGTPFVRHTLAERWNGTSWRRLRTPGA